jgi:hypothetical protein
MSTHLSQPCDSKQNPPTVYNGCGFIGNPDLYGIGIRLGVYSQWFSALLANHLLRRIREDVHSAYFLFSFALAIGTVVITCSHSGYPCVFFAEIYVLVSLFFGGYFSVHLMPVKVMSLERRDADPTPWKRGRLVILSLVYGAMMLYNCWFWFKGRTLGRFQPTPCGTALFLFGKFSGGNLHKAVGFYQAFSIFMAIYYPLGTFFLLQNVPSLLSRLDTVSAHYEYVRSIHGAIHTCLVSPRPLLLISLLCLVVAVLAIELTLLWNSVSGINSLNSVGQFIPLTVGVGGLVQVLWEIARESVSVSHKLVEPSSLGPR